MLNKQGSTLKISEQALASLKAHRFPGNIRELRNVIERAALMCDGDTILPGHLPATFLSEAAGDSSGDSEQIRTIDDIETEIAADDMLLAFVEAG